MKPILIAIGLFICFVANAQISIDQPPVIEQEPVSKKNWSTFLQFVKNDPIFSKAYYESLIPDRWGKQPINPKSENSPVTGVSWQQAQAYCEWRSLVSTYLNTHSTLSTYQQMQAANASAKTRITYRLPTEQEWVRLPSRFAKKSPAEPGFRCVYSIKHFI